MSRLKIEHDDSFYWDEQNAVYYNWYKGKMSIFVGKVVKNNMYYPIHKASYYFISKEADHRYNLEGFSTTKRWCSVILPERNDTLALEKMIEQGENKLKESPRLATVSFIENLQALKDYQYRSFGNFEDVVEKVIR